jgi:2-oxoglutarate ferredoxin oxidoreductase subunit alpha
VALLKSLQGGKILAKGNEALAQGAIDAGCRYFFGYPITPQNEVPNYMARAMVEAGGVFLQAESEVAAINMVYGAAAAGKRVMTASSSPGISLKQEGISYIAGAELPCVIVNIVRGGPGLGNVAPAQTDYWQATRGGGHGDYRTLVLAPWSVQELYDQMRDAFDLADRYRGPVLVLADAVLGQMMEPMEVTRSPVDPESLPTPPWATTGAQGRPKNIVNSLYIVPHEQEVVCRRLDARYQEAAERETRWESYGDEDAEIGLVAYGTSARVCLSALEEAAAFGLRVRLLRPITLYPFPTDAVAALADRVRSLLVVEMSLGQMVEDVRLAVGDRCPVGFFGRTGGVVPTPAEVAEAIRAVAAAEAPIARKV